MTQTHPSLTSGELLDRYRTMARIRAFELAARKLQAENRLWGTLHLSIGQEAAPPASAVSSSAPTTSRPRTAATATDRQGRASSSAMFAELLGRAAGYCKGRGGSMHIADVAPGHPRRERDRRRRDPDRRRRGVLAASVGGTLRRGRVLRRGRRRRGRLPREPQHGRAVEAAGRARLREQPLRRVDARAPTTAVPRRLRARGGPTAIAGERVDGNDVEAVADAARARRRARAAPAKARRCSSATTYRRYGPLRAATRAVSRPSRGGRRLAERDPLRVARRAASTGARRRPSGQLERRRRGRRRWTRGDRVRRARSPSRRHESLSRTSTPSRRSSRRMTEACP